MYHTDCVSVERHHVAAHVESIELEWEEAEARRAALESIGSDVPPGPPAPGTPAALELNAWIDAKETPLSDEELDLLAAHDEADRRGLSVYKLSCGSETKHVAARSYDAAYRKARRQKWPKGKGPINVAPVTGPDTRLGRFMVEGQTRDGRWVELVAVTARSAVEAVAIAHTLYPTTRIRPASLFSVEAWRLVAA